MAEDEEYCLLPLDGKAKGKFVMIDEEDYEWARKFIWVLANGKPRRKDGSKYIYLAREIMFTMYGEKFTGHVTYENKDPLDCRRLNLKATRNNRAKPEVVAESKVPRFAKIPVGCSGKVALVDLEDYEELLKYKWKEVKDEDRTYARKSGGKGNMHRHIMVRKTGEPIPKGMVVDHISGDGLDNRRENLRLATKRQNAQNHAVWCNNTSGYSGVSEHKPGSWVAYISSDIMINGVQKRGQKNLGTYKTKEEAYEVRRKAEIEEWGEFAPSLSRGL